MDWLRGSRRRRRSEKGHHPPSNSPKLKERDGADGDGVGGRGEVEGGSRGEAEKVKRQEVMGEEGAQEYPLI